MTDEHDPGVIGSNSMGPLVGRCAVCGDGCCNCLTCVRAKRDMLNVCAKCFRKVPVNPARVEEK